MFSSEEHPASAVLRSAASAAPMMRISDVVASCWRGCLSRRRPQPPQAGQNRPTACQVRGRPVPLMHIRQFVLVVPRFESLPRSLCASSTGQRPVSSGFVMVSSQSRVVVEMVGGSMRRMCWRASPQAKAAEETSRWGLTFSGEAGGLRTFPFSLPACCNVPGCGMQLDGN